MAAWCGTDGGIKERGGHGSGSQQQGRVLVDGGLAVRASIPKAPDHSRNHVREELVEDELADEYPTVVAWQCSEFP